MKITFDHTHPVLHHALGISNERLDQLKASFVKTIQNCLQNGIATITDAGDGFELKICISKLAEHTAKEAKTSEELLLCGIYFNDVREKVKEFSEHEALKYKLSQNITGEIKNTSL